MKLVDLLDHHAQRLDAERAQAAPKGFDAPITSPSGHLLVTVGSLHVYRFDLSEERFLPEDVPVSILPPGNAEPTEGFVIGSAGRTLVVQVFDALGQTLGSSTIVPDTAGFLETCSTRLATMGHQPEKFTLGPSERLVPWLDPEAKGGQEAARIGGSASVLTPLWGEDPATRRKRLATLAMELVRANKRLLLICPDHAAADEVLGVLAKAMRGAGLQYKSLLSRYELSLLKAASGMALGELGFEAQMHHFFARSRGDKASLRRKYERFRELTPLLAYKAEKQRDLNEVRLLEWRLLTQLTDYREKISSIDETLAKYEALPLFKRLTMQAAGKNVKTLQEYREIYEQNSAATVKELDIAKARIKELTPEAALPKEIKPEYAELKEEVIRLGGTKKIRELLAAGEGTNRQAFLQNKRLVITTGARVAADPLFERVRFDVLLVDEAVRVPAPFLLAAAGLARERIVLSADQREIPDPDQWASLERRQESQPLAG